MKFECFHKGNVIGEAYYHVIRQSYSIKSKNIPDGYRQESDETIDSKFKMFADEVGASDFQSAGVCNYIFPSDLSQDTIDLIEMKLQKLGDYILVYDVITDDNNEATGLRLMIYGKSNGENLRRDLINRINKLSEQKLYKLDEYLTKVEEWSVY
jgi:hypothetical protein